MAEQGEYGGPSFGGPGAFGGGFLGNAYNTLDKFTREKEKEAAKGILGKVAGAFLGPGWVGLEALSTLAKHTPNAIRNYTNFTPQSVPENLTGQKSLGHDQTLPGAYMDYDHNAFEHYNSPLQDMIDGILDLPQPPEEHSPVKGTGIELHGKPLGMKVSTKELPASVTPSVEQMLNWNPPQFDTNFNTNIPNPALTPEARQLDPDAANKALDEMGVPWGVNPISNISHSDTEREYAERALYSQIANQITQAAGQSSGRQAANAPVARPVVIPAGTQAANAPAPVRHDPIADLVRTVLSPKINQIKPETVKAIKKGRKPDYTMMSNYQQDLVRNILNPPKPPISSNYSSIANR